MSGLRAEHRVYGAEHPPTRPGTVARVGTAPVRGERPAAPQPIAAVAPLVSGSRWYLAWGKRVVDVVGASLVLLAASPVMITAWILLRVTLGRRLIITQDRVGLNGETFQMYKFRTMKWSRRNQPKPFNGPDRRTSHKVDSDPRHTPVGRVLRKASIDELPQLLNVLNGTMSLVGPRPELVNLVDEMQERGHVRHSVRPGMTGEWQVTDRQSGALLHESFDRDLPYLQHITLWHDLSIMARTVGVVVGRGGR